MTVSINSGGMEIIASGEIFLFDQQIDVSFRIQKPNWYLAVKLYFLADNTKEPRIDYQKYDGRLHMFCYNFSPEGGPKTPRPIGEAEGRTIYLMFRYFEDGKKGNIKRLVYTFYVDIEQGGPQNEII